MTSSFKSYLPNETRRQITDLGQPRMLDDTLVILGRSVWPHGLLPGTFDGDGLRPRPPSALLCGVDG